jgi:hypothetical protein
MVKDNGNSGQEPSGDEHAQYGIILRQQKALIESGMRRESAQPQATSTWADRNPGKPVQPCRKRAQRPKTTAELGTARLRSETMLENSEALAKEIQAIHAFQDNVIRQLAQKYKKSEIDVRSLLLSKPFLKSKRSVSITNALLHRKVKEVNEGALLLVYMFVFSFPLMLGLARPEGERLSLLEIQKTIDIGEEVNNLSEERRQELIRELEEHRELKQTGARASNKSAAQDMRQTLNRVTDEVSLRPYRVV